MANPNLLAATTASGTTDYLTPGGTTALVLVPNAASSGQVFKINQIVAANVNGSAAVDATVSIYTNGAVAKGSAPSGGTAYPIVSTVSVPADASLIDYNWRRRRYCVWSMDIRTTDAVASGWVVA